MGRLLFLVTICLVLILVPEIDLGDLNAKVNRPHTRSAFIYACDVGLFALESGVCLYMLAEHDSLNLEGNSQ